MLYMITIVQSRYDASLFDINVCSCYSTIFDLEVLLGQAYGQISVCTTLTSRKFSISEINFYYRPVSTISYLHNGFEYKMVLTDLLVTADNIETYIRQLQSDLALAYTRAMQQLFPRLYYSSPQINIHRY